MISSKGVWCADLCEVGVDDDRSLDSGTHSFCPDTYFCSLLAVLLVQLARVKVSITIETCWMLDYLVLYLCAGLCL